MKKIALFTAGSDAPGMNAAIRAVVRSAHYFGIECFGIYRGYDGMIKGDFVELPDSSVSNIVHQGGTILKSSVSKTFFRKEERREAFYKLKEQGFDAVVAIGGNGTLEGLSVFADEYGFRCVGVPATINNNLYGTDFTIGYDTAVNTALSAIDNIRDTADSHERVFFIEVIGSDSGFIAVRSAIGGGAETVILPQVHNPIPQVLKQLEHGIDISKSSQIVIIAEDAEGGRAVNIANQVNNAIPGLDIKVITLGDVQRGGAPTAGDRVLAGLLGSGAVEALIKGKTNVMVGLIDNCLSFTPFHAAVNKPKAVSKDLLRMIEILNGRQYKQN